MKYYISTLLLCVPLVLSANEKDNFDTQSIQKHIDVVLSDKSNHTDRVYWRSLLKWSDECESAFLGPVELQDPQDPNSRSGLELYPGQAQQYIMLVTCTLGSYQGYQLFYQIDLSRNTLVTHALKFPVFEFNPRNKIVTTMTDEVWGNVLNDSNYNKLVLLNRYSGYGHCGTLTTYKIINGIVTATTLRAQPDCELENASRDVEQWKEYKIPVIK